MLRASYFTRLVDGGRKRNGHPALSRRRSIDEHITAYAAAALRFGMTSLRN